jgi:hypothetical protein
MRSARKTALQHFVAIGALIDVTVHHLSPTLDEVLAA